MVLERLWRYIKKAFRKKRKPSRKRRHPKTSGKRKKKTPSLKKRAAVKTRKRQQRAAPALKQKAKSPPALKEKGSLKALRAGSITHYFPKVNAAVIKLAKKLHVGDPVLIKGPKTNFRQTVGSMQINRIPIESGKAGQEIGLEVFKEVRPGDQIFILRP